MFKTDKWEYTPTWRGFDYFYGYYTGGEDYFTHISGGYFDWREDIGKNCGANCSKVDIDAYGNYSTYLLTNKTIDILSQYKQQQKNNPFFVYLAWQNVHAPAQVPAQYEWAYNNTISDLKRRKYAGMVSAMDQGIGNITSKLKEYGLDNNTLIFFMSDNGAPVDTGDAVGGSNYAMRGGKHSIFDGGTRVLSIMYVPEVISSKYKNYKPNVMYHNLMHSVDVGVTILDAVGIDHNDTSLDGVSHWNALMKVSDDIPRDGFYYGHDVPNQYAWAGNNTGIRMNEWKLLNKTGGEPSGWYPTPNTSIVDFMEIVVALNYSLYNLTSDPDEHFDVAVDNVDVVTELLSLLEMEELTAVPQVEPNENCPDPTHPTYPVVGEIWEPWCSN